MPTVFRALCAALFCVLLISVSVAETIVLNLRDVRASTDQRTGRPVVLISLSAASSRAFAAFTTTHVGKPLEISVDGEVLVSPILREPIIGGVLQFDLRADSDLTPGGIAGRMLKPDAKVEVSVK